MVRIFRAVYKWAAKVLYINTWTEREITALEAENLIKQLSKILEVPIQHDTTKK
jgi:hypothetical protein